MESVRSERDRKGVRFAGGREETPTTVSVRVRVGAKFGRVDGLTKKRKQKENIKLKTQERKLVRGLIGR